ncbi:Isa2p [Sugiyamaella lignohabitans]|uniref:Isa2p n=1 Tax=Sugiyamaella lignohabitans TaxID=796027 RepID=A0A161HIS1_9ASCO|nr:Isa2p [Sugiyamaella lignohabitans]ANB11118.1 Isa2p [Sugiyamaella lignohabitans]
MASLYRPLVQTHSGLLAGALRLTAARATPISKRSVHSLIGSGLQRTQPLLTYNASAVASRSVRRIVSSPTLGPKSATKITNPIKSENGQILRVDVSQKAAEKLNLLKSQDNNPDLALRISVESGGCHGFQYIYSLKTTKDIDSSNDSVFERDGAKVIIDATSLEIIQQSTIDYTTELIGSQFKVINSPFATSSCGCGSSFAFDPAAAAAAAAAATSSK